MKSINWKYAFGEILIVIIGISIAFSMNKCSENSKHETQRKQYVTNLSNDIEADKMQLQINVREIEMKITQCDNILPHLGTGSPDKMKIVEDIIGIATISNFSTKDITYQTLINSSDLKLIKIST